MQKFLCQLIIALLASYISMAQHGNKPMKNNAPGISPGNVFGLCTLDSSLTRFRKSVEYRKSEEKMNREILSYERPLNDDTIVVPVVFHIINQDPSTIPDSAIVNALKDLNDAYAKRGIYSGSNGVDTKIRFCLSQKDPDGGLTTGITRTKSFFSTHLNPLIEDARLKRLVQWDPAQYVNIWYISSMNLESFAQFVCGAWTRSNGKGYATMPPGGDSLDGIVVTGFSNILIHEMGHYLGLYHIFEGSSCLNNDCTTDGDKVCDTPPASVSNSSAPCTSPDNSCNTDTLSNYSNGNFTSDVPDQAANFMNFGNVACQNQFTQGQADRMIATINTQRSGLLQSKCNKPCTENIRSEFTRDNPYPIPGNLVSFTNKSSGAGSFQWLVNDVVVSAAKNFNYTFSAVGKYKVTLKAYNTPSCYAMYTDYVIVNCGVTARFYTDKRTIASKIPIYADTVIFTNTSENATSFQWMMSNDDGMAEQLISSAKDLVYVFPSPANYSVRLIATNGTCTDTTEMFIIPVADPTADGIAYMKAINCYEKTKVRVSFFVCNYGYATIPANTPVSFYDGDPLLGNANKLDFTFYLPDSIPGNCCGTLNTTIIDVHRPGLEVLYMVFNDSGNTKPLVLPNTPLVESNYANNILISSGIRFKASVLPSSATLTPGDTLQLTGRAGPGTVTSYTWSPALNLSCTQCSSPYLVADSDRVKRMVATSQYGCVDTAYVNIKVPPPNDYTISINQVECAGTDSLFVNFSLGNLFKRGMIPKGLLVSFYNGDPSSDTSTVLLPPFSVPADVDSLQFTYNAYIRKMGPGRLYAVVNDSGITRPLSLPNTPFPEKNYNNNKSNFNYIEFQVSATPSAATMEPGDTIQLIASASPGIVNSYSWSSITNLSCPSCDTTKLIADSNRLKKVIAVNQYGCADSAFVDIKVPPANDYTLDLNDVQCAAGEKLLIDFTIQNSFKRGIIPKGLTVAFYEGDPATDSARLLPPVFSVQNTVFQKRFTFTSLITGITGGSIYAVVNDSGTVLPVILPNNSHLPEKDYTNNRAALLYTPEKVQIQPADTLVLRKTSFPLRTNTTIYNPASTTWFSGTGNTLSCRQCLNPVITVLDHSTVTMQTENKYGCLIQGTAVVKILPPDFTIKIIDTKCYSNSTTLVKFDVCMNNNYDSVFAGIPVSFYDAPLSGGSTQLLSPIFLTRGAKGNCFTFEHIIKSPSTGKIYAIVNHKGSGNTDVPANEFAETRTDNNIDNRGIAPFNVSIYPADTSVERSGSLQLDARVEGGSLSSYLWRQDPSLSCTTCLSPVVKPLYTTSYMLVARNEYSCTDTAYSIVKTFTGGSINIPSAFSPNGDGLNDVFYVLAGTGISQVKDFIVFNRWGQKVFEAKGIAPNDPRHGWNGTYKGVEAAPGAYVYIVRVNNADGKEQVYKGNIVLLR